MIAICEAQCKAFSHEKFNSGFIYGLRLAFPQEAIRFYCDPSHEEAVKKMLLYDKAHVENIEYVPIEFRTEPGLIRLSGYFSVLARIFTDVAARGLDKVFFLSFNPEMLYVIKKLKQRADFERLKFTLVLHGSLESIAPALPVGRAGGGVLVSLQSTSLFSKLRRVKFVDVPKKVMRMAFRGIRRNISPWRKLSSYLLSEKKMLLWRHSQDFRYVCLSPHVRANAARYLDVAYLNFHSVVLPAIFSIPTSRPENDYAKFAIFGYGDSSKLHELLLRLSERNIHGEYEIRIIGMDNRGTDGFKNVTCMSPGKPLARSDMERHAIDIDMFLILYDSSRYRLSCSGSILEALSHIKPILHLDNECINYFNRPEAPIGIRCDDIVALASVMQHVIENYRNFGAELSAFRKNILKVREKCNIEGSVQELRRSFLWQPERIGVVRE